VWSPGGRDISDGRQMNEEQSDRGRGAGYGGTLTMAGPIHLKNLIVSGSMQGVVRLLMNFK